MLSEEEMQAMMSVGESEPETTEDTGSENNNTQPETVAQTDEAPVEANSEISVSDVNQTTNVVSDTISNENSVKVSDIILNNVDKHIKMILLNDSIHQVNSDADVNNYIVYVNTDKKIPCIYDCEGLCVPKSSVMDENGNYNIVSIEGRRSGFVIKTPTRDLVMTKNFIYDCVIDNGVITSVNQYNRKRKIEKISVDDTLNDFDSASLLVGTVLPKIVKCGKYTTIEALREQVQKSYDSVNDINAMFKIIELRLKIGC